jgi:pimeloyl-ACP methyl ester carboxylesterase
VAILPTETDNGIRYYRAGSGPTRIVLVHGLGTSLDFWNAVAPNLAKSVEVLAFDLPGSGHSIFRGSRYELKTVAMEAVTFLESEAKGDSILVGHSLGALVVLQMVALRPSIAKRIILVDPVLFSVERSLTNPRAALRDPRLLLITLAQFVGVLIPAPVTNLILRSPSLRAIALSSYIYAPRKLDVGIVRDALSGISLKTSMRLLNVLRVAKDVNLTGLSKQVKSDAYVIRGIADPLCPDEDVHRLSEAMSVVGQRQIPRCGHMPMLERPDELVRLLLDITTDQRSGV